MGPFRTAQALAPPVPREGQGSPLIEVTGVGVRYFLGSRREDVQSLAYNVLFWRQRRKAVWALRDIDLVGYPGDILGIIGLNGAGKTTLCRVLSGLLHPDAGEIRVEGEVSALLSLGTGFNAQLSGRENILLNGLMLGLSRIKLEALLPEIVELSGLGQFIDQPLKNYSAGMKARLGFSIAAAIESEILIIDEALSAGDLVFREKAGRKMHELIGKSKMVIVVTHQLDFVERYCTKVLWLDRGRVQAAGRPDEVVPRYRVAIPTRGVTGNSLEISRAKPRSRPIEVIVARDLGVKFSLLETNRNCENKRWYIPTIWKNRKGRFWALNDINFTLNEGEIVGVIGPNGAGKTTLCKVLTGILKADQGQVSVGGEITALLTLGAGFNHQLTGHDNIYLNGMMLGMSKPCMHEVYGDIVMFSGLGRFIEEPVKHYSQGMRSRLGFSIAALLNPDILIIDETLSTGDAAFHEKATARIQELMTRAKAVIVVTHNLVFVEKVCTRALWLGRGAVQFDGDPKEAVAHYLQSKKTV